MGKRGICEVHFFADTRHIEATAIIEKLEETGYEVVEDGMKVHVNIEDSDGVGDRDG